MNFKRGRAKNQRAGCLFCKPHKANGCGKCLPAELRACTVAEGESDYRTPYEAWLDRVCGEDSLEIGCDCGYDACPACGYGELPAPTPLRASLPL